VSSPVAPPKPPPPANPKPTNIARPSAPVATGKRFSVSSGARTSHQRVVLYGSGGIGKSELASNLKGIGMKPLFIDIGNGTSFLDVDRIPDLTTWDELRAALHDQELWKGYNAVVIDDLSSAESLAAQWVIANVPSSGTSRADSIESYGWGKGYTHVYETFLQLLGDLDAHIRAGRTVVCIAHECTAKVPNPAGADYIRYEPRLQNSNQANIRARVKEWADHLLFVGYDVFARDGKATGSGTRTIYPVEMPTHLAKSRSLSSPIVYERGSFDLWRQLLTTEGK
jgi:hypothetical protein